MCENVLLSWETPIKTETLRASVSSLCDTGCLELGLQLSWEFWLYICIDAD